MSLQPPSSNWKTKSLGRDEKVWIYLIILMILMMGIMTLGYVFIGDQNVPEEYQHFDSVDEMRTTFREGNSVSEISFITLENGASAFSRMTTGDIYLLASQWQWSAQNDNDEFVTSLQFKQGVRYKLHLGSTDVLHGFQLIGSDFIISLQIVPLYDYVLEFTPNESGTFRIICNEYCGFGHHGMTSFFEVVP